MSFFIKDILGDTINDRKAVNTTSKDTIAKDPSIQHGYKRLRNSEQGNFLISRSILFYFYIFVQIKDFHLIRKVR